MTLEKRFWKNCLMHLWPLEIIVVLVWLYASQQCISITYYQEYIFLNCHHQYHERFRCNYRDFDHFIINLQIHGFIDWSKMNLSLFTYLWKIIKIDIKLFTHPYVRKWVEQIRFDNVHLSLCKKESGLKWIRHCSPSLCMKWVE